MANIGAPSKATTLRREPRPRVTGDALLRSEDLVPFVLACFERAVRTAAARAAGGG